MPCVHATNTAPTLALTSRSYIRSSASRAQANCFLTSLLHYHIPPRGKIGFASKRACCVELCSPNAAPLCVDDTTLAALAAACKPQCYKPD